MGMLGMLIINVVILVTHIYIWKYRLSNKYLIRIIMCVIWKVRYGKRKKLAGSVVYCFVSQTWIVLMIYTVEKGRL